MLLSNHMIGKNAVDALNIAASKAKYLLTEIPVGDTYPTWDGEIIVYSSEDSRNKRSKSNIIGRVPVQVKGKFVEKFSEGERKYSIEVEDLINYYNDSGALFFIVEMTDMYDPYKTKIFYAELLVSDISKLIDGKKEQKTVTHTFQELSKDRINTICRHFLLHRKKQGYDHIKYDPSNKYSKYIFTIVGREESDLDFHLFNSGTYIYGIDKDSNIEVPISRFKADAKIEEVEFNIGTKKKIYFDRIYREISRDDTVIRFGKGFTFKLDGSMVKFDINYIGVGNIRERITDSEFLLDIATSENLYLNESQVKLSFDIKHREDLMVNLPKHIKKLKEILHAFNEMGVEPKEDFNKLKKYNNQINLLIDITRGQVPRKIVNNHKEFLKVTIGKYNFLFVKGTKKDSKNIFNIFDYEKLKENYRIVVSANKSLEEAVEHSPYVLVKPDELLEFDNLNVDAIEKSLMSIDYKEQIAKEVTNNFLLDTLHYVDKKQIIRQKDILNMVIRVYDYIMEYDEDVIYFINKTQATLRIRNLNDDEIKNIISFKNEYNEDKIMLCAFDILLGSYTEFEYHFNQLSEEERINLMKFPIYNLVIDRYSRNT